MANKEARFTIERRGRIEDLDRSFDIDFWQRLGPEAILAEAWEMVRVVVARVEPVAGEPTLDKSVETLRRLPD